MKKVFIDTTVIEINKDDKIKLHNAGCKYHTRKDDILVITCPDSLDAYRILGI